MDSLRRLVFPLVLMALSFGVNADSIDINTATADMLAQSLTGVGPERAKAIVAYRAANGPFKSVDELAKVKGIGPSIVDRNRTSLSLGADSDNR